MAVAVELKMQSMEELNTDRDQDSIALMLFRSNADAKKAAMRYQ